MSQGVQVYWCELSADINGELRCHIYLFTVLIIDLCDFFRVRVVSERGFSENIVLTTRCLHFMPSSEPEDQNCTINTSNIIDMIIDIDPENNKFIDRTTSLMQVILQFRIKK